MLPGGLVHRYYVSSSTEASTSLQTGVLVSKITFMLPTSVPAVISLLRQQALFNTVLISCLRPSSLTGVYRVHQNSTPLWNFANFSTTANN